jgi:hypothetical protein
MPSSVVGAVGSVWGAGKTASGQQEAAQNASNQSTMSSIYATQLQDAAQQRALDLQARMYDTNRADTAAWRDVGVNSLAKLQGLTNGLDDYMFKAYTPNEFNFQADPGYDWRIGQGQQAIDRSAAARGGLQSGAALKEAQRYGQNFASNEYQNAYNRWNTDETNNYNRYNTQQNNVYNKLATLAGMGQVANTQLGQAGTNYANSTSGTLANTANNLGNIWSNNAANQSNVGYQNANANSSMYSGIGNALGGASQAGGSGGWGNTFSNIGNYFGGNFGASGNWTNPDTGSSWIY